MRRRLAGEEGVAMAVAIAVLTMMMVLASVAVWQAVAALNVSTRDGHIKSAGQAADGAIDAAVYHHDRIDLENAVNLPLDPTAVPSQACVAIQDDDLAVVDLGSAVPDFEGKRWCPAVTEEQGDGTRWSYRVSELARVGIGPCGEDRIVSLDRTVVAVGESRGTVRRVKVTLRAPITLLSGAAVQSSSSTVPLTVGDLAAITGDVRSNGDITTSGTTTTTTVGGVTTTTTSSAGGTVTGNAIPGPPAHTVAPGVTVTGTRTPACEQFDLPDVDAGDSESVNDNATIVHDGKCIGSSTSALGVVSLSLKLCKLPLLTQTGSVTWDPTKRTLALDGDARLELPNDTYSFCKITLTGSSAIVIPYTSAVTRIFLEDPTSDRCKDVPGAGQISIDGTSRLINCHPVTNPETLQIYGIGSATAATVQSLAGGGALSALNLSTLCGVSNAAGTPMFVYAPRSTVQVRGSTEIVGQVAGGVVQVGGSAKITAITGAINIGSLGAGALLPIYTPVDYVECTARSFSDPEILANPSKEC